MQALFELTDGIKKLKEIIGAFPPESPHWNEAQNRFQFVDRLLVECLGWERQYMKVEETDELGGRADYILGHPPKAVLEAKKEAVLFDILPIGKPSTVRKLEPLLHACKKLEAAVLQVIPYCSIRGTPIAIICNGPQLLIFQAIIIGQSPLEGECYLFNGFDSYITNFPLLWRMLSPEGITENRALRELALHRNPRVPPKASTAIPEPTKYRYRNSFQENLRALGSLLLEEIQDDPAIKPAFYHEGYVSLEANNRHLLLSKRIIATRYNRVAGDGVAPTAIEKVAGVDETGNLQISDPSLSYSMGARPVVVVGDVGVGKTSFFENLFESLETSEKANSYFIHVNLGIKATLAADIKSYVLSEIPNVLLSRYGIDIFTAEFVNAIYHADLQRFDRGIQGALRSTDPAGYQKARLEFLEEKVKQKDTHLHAALGHLAHGRRKQIILVIDNADQRNFQVQQEAFLIAQELAATRNLLVFVALRPSTFYVSKTTGALSGYQNKILTIAPPPADEVLYRRITFAVRVAQGKISPSSLEGIRFQLKGIIYFLEATLRSIRSNAAIKTFLGNITGGNTRLVIELITAFCGSPNVDSEKIVEIEETQGRYDVPLHEFTKHALLGDYAYYHPQSSLVACNIFDVSTADPREHFLAGLIIAFLSSSAGLKDNDGFVEGARVMQEMLGFGYAEEQIRFALRKLAAKRLVETPHAHYREIEVADNEPAEQFYFRATSIGIYHIRYWMGEFSFLDATCTDTPVFDAVARGEIFEVASSFDIGDRFQRSMQFKGYLEHQWHQSNLTAVYFDLPALFKSQDDSFHSVKQFIDRGRGKRRF
jgi:GTPase SAR1 family protein